jgi:DNA-binding beta-propeller fold protein YncE
MAKYMRKDYGVRGLLILMMVFLCSGNSHRGVAPETVEFVQEMTSHLYQPVDVAVSPEGDVYVLDKKLGQVFIFSADGTLKQRLGTKGDGLGQLYKPESLVLSLNGDIVIADTGNSRVQVFSRAGHFLYELGNAGSEPGKFRHPNCVAVDQMGYLFVGDRVSRTISKFSPRGVFLDAWATEHTPDDIVFDIQQNMYVLYREAGKIVQYPPFQGKTREVSLDETEKNFIREALGIGIDGRGDIYLLDRSSNQVHKIDQESQILLSFGSRGKGRGQFNMPMGIVAGDADKVYIADTLNGRVQVLRVSGSVKDKLPAVIALPPILDFVQSIDTKENVADLVYVDQVGLYILSGSKGQILVSGTAHRIVNPSGQPPAGPSMSRPQALHVSSQGKILVADTGNHRLQFLDTDGSYRYHFGIKGHEAGEFQAPQGVTTDQEGNIYIADTKNHRIQIFNPDGIYLRSFGEKSEEASITDARPGTFLFPTDLIFDSQQQLYVLDSENRRIQIFDKNGKFIKQMGGKIGNIQFKEPIDISLDENDYLYVADREEHRVLIFDSDGQVVLAFGSAGYGPAYFPSLSAIESSQGNIYVADEQADKIQVFAFRPDKRSADDRVYFIRTSQPLSMENSSPDIQRVMARKLLMDHLRAELSTELGLEEDLLDNVVVIESEKFLSNGRLQMTISLPKDILPEELAPLSHN